VLALKGKKCPSSHQRKSTFHDGAPNFMDNPGNANGRANYVIKDPGQLGVVGTTTTSNDDIVITITGTGGSGGGADLYLLILLLISCLTLGSRLVPSIRIIIKR